MAFIKFGLSVFVALSASFVVIKSDSSNGGACSWASGESWSYGDVGGWDSLGACSGVINGKDFAQSPIDLDPENVIDHQDSDCNKFSWNLDLLHGKFEVKNNGHSVVVTPVEKIRSGNRRRRRKRRSSSSSDRRRLRRNRFNGNRHRRRSSSGSSSSEDDDEDEWNYLKSNNETIGKLATEFHTDERHSHKEYCLDSFHFHWSDNSDEGSEHFVDGKSYPLEVHFVHFSCEYTNLVEALCDSEDIIQNDREEDYLTLAVVGVFFELDEETGNENAGISSIFKDGLNIDTLANQGEVDYISDLNLNDLIPDDIAFWSYEGSLTTPPCSPIVRWHVIKQPLKIQEHQLNWFRELMSGQLYRPVQDTIGDVSQCHSDQL